jgi:hypothetical protein
MTTPTTNPTACSIVNTNRINNIPLVRFNLFSPYSNRVTGITTGITEQQLSMRRKAEILKYSSNRMPSQTNSLTKKQLWSRLVTQPPRGRRYTDVSNCAADILLPIPTTSSGVPGPIMFLYEDPNVPLYNYIITRTYAYNIPNPNSYWETTVNINVGLYSNMGDGVFGLNVLPNINKPQYTYVLNIPVGLHAEGVMRTNTPKVFRIKITTAKLDVFCNGTYITNLTQTKTDINKYIQFTIPNNSPFIITQMVDVLAFSGIVLQTSPINTFSFGLTLSFDIYDTETHLMTSIDKNTTFSTFIQYAYANMTDVIPFDNINCQLNFPSPALGYSEPHLYGL